MMALAQAVTTVLAPATAPGLAAVAALAAVGAVSSLRSRAGIDVPDGDLLLETGVRVRSGPLLREAAAAPWIALGWTAVALVDGVVSRGPASVVVVPTLAVVWAAELLVVRARRANAASIRAHFAALRGDVAEAKRWLAAVGSAQPEAVRATSAWLATREGDGSEGERAAEARWSGGLDVRAAALALIQIDRRDDDVLARRWLAAARPDPSPYERFLEAQLRARLALLDGAPDEALTHLAPWLDGPVPEPYLRPARLLVAAALRAEGDAAGADAALRALSPPWEADTWRRTAQRALWRRVTGEEGAAPPPAVLPAPDRPPAQPFAPPADDLPAPVTRAPRFVGIVPVEGMPALPAVRRWVDRVRGVALLALLALSPVLLGLTVLLFLLGTPEDWVLRLAWPVGVGGLLVGSIGAVPRWFVPWGARPAFVLDDGRMLPVSWWRAFGAAGWPTPAAVLCASVAFADTWVLALFGALALLTALLAALRWRRWATFRDAFDPDPTRLLARPVPAVGPLASQLRAWRALARLRIGDADGASAEVRLGLASGQDAGFVARWISAGRGELDLEALLRAPEPTRLGDRYRAAVTLLLAAGAAGASDRIAPRLDAAEALAAALPNAFGDLLARLATHHRGALGAPAPAPPGTEWMGRIWTFLGR